jgi:hypothetical protein
MHFILSRESAAMWKSLPHRRLLENLMLHFSILWGLGLGTAVPKLRKLRWH